MMEKRMPRESTDELALAKSAAWAWFQRGSGSEGKTISEFNLMRTRCKPIPSRYKKQQQQQQQQQQQDMDMDVDDEVEASELHSLGRSPTHTDISLLDSAEIESISRQLDCLLEYSRRAFSDHGLSSPYTNGLDHGKFVASPKNGTRRSFKMAGKVNGFWLRHAVGLCSTGGGVVEASILGPRARGLKHSSVVRLATR